MVLLYSVLGPSRRDRTLPVSIFYNSKEFRYMLSRYECLMLAIPEITQDEIKSLEKDLDSIVKKAKGTTVSFERWGKFKLAYPVKKNDYGVYFLHRFEVDSESDLLKDIKSHFIVKLTNTIMRNMMTVLDMDASLVYQRPQSLEEVPTKDVSTFLKENNMEGLLSSVDSKDKKEVKKAAPATTPEADKTEKTEEAPAVDKK